MSTLKQTKTMIGSTSSDLWTWKHIVYEYFDDDYITYNRSRIIVESYLGRPSWQSTQSFGGSANINITCDGQSRSTSNYWNYGANQVAGGAWCLIQSETFYVEHNADGTKSISVSSTLSNAAFNPNSASASGDMTLTTIPRATACPNLDGYIESSAPISLNPASSSFKHRIYYSYNGKTGYYPSSSGFFSSTGSLSLDSTFYSYTSKSSGTGSITLYTYDSSGNQIGSKTGTLTVRCDKEKCRPVISLSVVDSNDDTIALTGNSSKLIKGYSNAKVTYTITTRNSASLKSKTLNGGSLGTSPFTIYKATYTSYSIQAIDSRDFDTTESKSCTMVDYVPLTLDFDAYRPSPTGSEIRINFQGNYYNNTFGSVTNTISLSWKYRVKGSTNWTNGGTFIKDTDYSISGNRYSSKGNISLGNIFDYQTNYEICVFYTDKLINTNIAKTVPKGQPVISWEDKKVNVNGTLTINNSDLIDIIYPVNSIYMSVNSTNPKNLFGGTWEQLKDRFLLGAGNTYSNGQTGGSSTHKLTTSEMPSHTHTQNAHYHAGLSYGDPDGGGNTCVVSTVYDGSGCIELGWSRSSTGYPFDNVYTKYVTATNKNTGGGSAHNNMPPYLVVYMWKRTA